VIPHQRLTINNSAAINSSIKRISFVTPQTAFSEHNSLISTDPIDVPDANDDLTRELAFYKVCQSAAVQARKLLKKEGIPFTRPADYFAEMVKTDEDMTMIKKKLYDEAASKKASADARRQRDLKKFGKQVQVAKLQQRAKEKRDTLEKINSLKRSTCFFISFFKQNLILTTSQNARVTRPPPPVTTICSTSPLTTAASPTTAPAVPSPNEQRRTKSMVSEARNGLPSLVTLRPRPICAAFPSRR
jgi:hypothetical protein